jgi:hypothetical protein
MVDWNAWNPFARREEHTRQSITAYKILTILSWLLAVIPSLYYTFDDPRDGHSIRKRLWDINLLYPTAFTLNPIITTIYWLLLFVLQIGYVGHLFSKNPANVNAAANVGSHFILNNVLHFAFVLLFVDEHFILAEIVLILNFFNLTNLYFLHRTNPTFVHIPTASGPLAWTFVAVYWNGALMLHHPAHTVARIFGNIFIWSIPAFGYFCLILFKDYTIGFALSILTASIGVAQFLNQVIALQWIFAFVIMSLLFLSSIVVASRAWLQERPAPADTERAPLLADNA